MYDAIYTWGYGEQMVSTLQALGHLASIAGGLVAGAFAIGFLIVIFFGSMKQQGMLHIWSFLFFGVTIVEIFFHSTDTFVVEDEFYGSATVVNDVPTAIGILLSLTTSAERALMHAFEDAYSTPNSQRYSSYGVGFSMVSHLSLNQARPMDQYFIRTFNEYISQCYSNYLLTDAKRISELVHSSNIQNELGANTIGYTTLVYDASHPNGQVMICSDAWAAIQAKIPTEANNAIGRIARHMRMDSSKVASGMAETSQLFFGISKSAQDYATQLMLKNMLSDGLMAMSYAAGADPATAAYGAAISSRTMRDQQNLTGFMSKEVLPLYKAIAVLLVTAISLLMAVFSLLFAAWRHLLTAVTLFLALMLWGTIATILNFYIAGHIESAIAQYTNGEWLTIAHMGLVDRDVTSYFSFLMYMSVFIPIIAYTLVKGSEMGFVQLFSGGTAAAANAANAGAGQTATGNVNLANGRVGQMTAGDRYGNFTRSGEGYNFESVGQDGAGNVYRAQGSTINGGSLSTVTGGAGSTTLDNSQATTTNLSNVDTGIQSAIATGKQERVSQVNTAAQSVMDTASAAYSQSAMRGETDTSAESLAKTLGVSASDARNMSASIKESTTKAITKTLEEAHRNGSVSSTDFGLSAHAGWKTSEVAELVTGVHAGIDGKITFSGKNESGESFSFTLGESESRSFSKEYQAGVSKAFNDHQDAILSQADTLQRINSFNDSDVKQAAHNYQKALSEQESYEKGASRMLSENGSLSVKTLQMIQDRFIAADDRLSDLFARNPEAAVNEANKRISDAAIGKGAAADQRELRNAVEAVIGANLANIRQDSENMLNAGKINNSAAIETGKNRIKSMDVVNPVESRDLKAEYDETRNEIAQNSRKEMADFGAKHAQGNEAAADNMGRVLQEHKDAAQSDRSAFTAIGGATSEAVGGTIGGLPSLAGKAVDWIAPGVGNDNSRKDGLRDSKIIQEENQVMRSVSRGIESGFIKEGFATYQIDDATAASKLSDDDLRNILKGQNAVPYHKAVTNEVIHAARAELGFRGAPLGDVTKGDPNVIGDRFFGSNESTSNNVKRELNELKDNIESLERNSNSKQGDNSV
jgi:conjugal transfer mating pair stabilization protein TraG